MEHILPPVTVDDRLPWWSVNVDLPPEIDQEIRRYVAEEELTSWTLMIHGALYIYRALFWTREQLRAEFESMIEEGCRSAEQDGGREATPAFWEEFRQKAERDAERLDQLQAEGKVGNLLLPKELYELVQERVAAGACNTPTEVVCAAVPYLRREREESKKRGGGVDDGPLPEEEQFIPRTECGKELWELRKDVLKELRAHNEPLLDAEGIRREVRDRRGEGHVDMDVDPHVKQIEE